MIKTSILKKAYIKPEAENIITLCSYLDDISGKELNIKLIRQYLFKTSWNGKEDRLKSRCHIKAASKYLKFLHTNGYSEKQIKIVIADLSKYIPSFDENEDVSFMIISTNVLPSAVHFKIIEHLFYENNIDLDKRDNYSTDLLTIYGLRLSLEKRIRGLLGIDYAVSNGHTIGLNSLIMITKKLKNVEYSKSINWVEIEMVNKWLNHFIHRHIRPYPWVIHEAFEVLKPFIDPDKPIYHNGSRIYSFCSATCVKDEDLLEEEILNNLKLKYPEIKIKWLSKREILQKK